MPLAATDVPGIEDIDGVRFPMMDGAEIVAILVTREALEEIESPPPAPGGYVDRLQAYRRWFEDLASIKHDAGNVETDGTIRITAADLG
jgi:hypothetical protein